MRHLEAGAVERDGTRWKIPLILLHILRLCLFKADTGANVNLMNRQMFNQLFGQAKVLQLTPIRMEKLWKFSSKSAWDGSMHF